MHRLFEVIEHISGRVNLNLREFSFDVSPYLKGIIDLEKLPGLYASYGLSVDHPLNFSFTDSSLAGSYFLGNCRVDGSIVYKSDVRGDELKLKGQVFEQDGLSVSLTGDEQIWLKESFLNRTLVHNFSHDIENPELFHIEHTVAMPYANIHGAPVEGSFLGAFSTIDLTTVHDSIIGEFAYVQTGELDHARVEPGRIWVKGPDFEFNFCHDPEVLKRYISHKPGQAPEGLLMEFREALKPHIHEIFSTVKTDLCQVDQTPSEVRGVPVQEGSYLSEFAVVRGDCRIGPNVLVSQRAFLENAQLEKGANAQENCYIIDSRLEELDITAHGGKVIKAHLGPKVFTGFNSLIRGAEGAQLKVGAGTIIMPHTIIDLVEPLEIPARSLVWGFIQNKDDLSHNSISLEQLTGADFGVEKGGMRFTGKGGSFVGAFEERLHHILEVNGAFYDGADENRGHAQMSQRITYNVLQPYAAGDLLGMHPSISIRP